MALARTVGIASGTWVVHTCSPPARVASLCTGTPSSLENAAVSASHNSLNLPATSRTGQWPWHSWTAKVPSPISRTVAAYPSALSASA